MRTVAIIPARYDSVRLPGKPLLDLGGQSMIYRVYQQVCKASKIDQAVVATDDERIHTHLSDLGAAVVMTHNRHQSGTDRCWQACQILNLDADIIINVQGDEPFTDPIALNDFVDFTHQSQADIATMMIRIEQQSELFDHNVVKVVGTQDQKALYFSREPIPHLRDLEREQWLGTKKHFQHLGIYAFTKAALEIVAQLPQSNLEKAERLEQLRWLENGLQMSLYETSNRSLSIDTPEDLLMARKMLEAAED